MAAVTIVHSLITSVRLPVLLVHGAANSSMVWRYWQQALAGAGLRRGHGYGGMHGDYALAGTRSRGTLESRRGS